MLLAEEQLMRTTQTVGSSLSYPEEILAMAAEGGYTWTSTQSAYEAAHHYYAAFKTGGEARDLTCNPLIKRMVEIMVANNTKVQVRAATLPPVEDTLTLEMAAEAGIY